MCRGDRLISQLIFFLVVGVAIVLAPISAALSWMSVPMAGVVLGIVSLLGAVYFALVHPNANKVHPKYALAPLIFGLIVIGTYSPMLRLNEQTAGEAIGDPAAEALSVLVLFAIAALIGSAWFAADLLYDEVDEPDSLAREIKRRVRDIRGR